jgi:hypothetical protein
MKDPCTENKIFVSLWRFWTYQWIALSHVKTEAMLVLNEACPPVRSVCLVRWRRLTEDIAAILLLQVKSKNIDFK